MSDKIMARIRALLAIAEHPNTGEHEADTAMRQAASLMAKHAIDEAIMRAGQSESERRAPTKKFVSISEGFTEWNAYLRSALALIAQHNHCQYVYDPAAAQAYRAENGLNYGAGLVIFGMQDDVSWVEMLYTTVHFQFLSKISPKWDLGKTYDENVYNFKVAGYTWDQINGYAMQADASLDVRLPNGRNSSKIITAYRRHAKKIGDDNPVATTSHDAYRRGFADGFLIRLAQRLDDEATAAQQTADSMPGAAVALVDSDQAVRDAFYAQYPDADPEAIRRRQAELVRQRREQERREQEARDAMLDAMTPAQRAAFHEKEQRQARAASKREDRYWREQAAKSAAARPAARRGAAAADTVNLSRYAGRADAAAERGELS